MLNLPQAIKIQPSVIAYIAKSLAHVGKQERRNAYRSCDIAFEHFHSSHVSFLLLIKVRFLSSIVARLLNSPQAIVVFMAGRQLDAISRIDDLIATLRFNSICYVVQARLHCTHEADITTNVFNRPTCIFSSEMKK